MDRKVLRPIDSSRFSVADISHIIDMAFGRSLALIWRLSEGVVGIPYILDIMSICSFGKVSYRTRIPVEWKPTMTSYVTHLKSFLAQTAH